jgi:hypothetical protein
MSIRLRPTVAPNLPLATPDYDSSFINKFANVLRLYFNTIDNYTQSLLNGIGGGSIQFPYGAFASYTTQTATANTATLLTFSQTDFADGVSLVSGSKLKVTAPGIYNLQFSVQLSNLENAPIDTSIWLRQGNDGGTSADIVGSTGLVGMPQRKSASVPTHDIKGWNYFISMATDDYVQIYWSTTSANVTIPTYPASVSPTRPSTASVVATLSFVSAI